jgi:hypothetical protein
LPWLDTDPAAEVARAQYTAAQGTAAAVGRPQNDDLNSVRRFPFMPPEAFTGLAGEIVRLIEPHTESDPAGLLLSAHAFFGNCVGRGPHYVVESTKHGPNLYVLKIGDTAKARKGTGEDRVRALFNQVDEVWTTQRLHPRRRDCGPAGRRLGRRHIMRGEAA